MYNRKIKNLTRILIALIALVVIFAPLRAHAWAESLSPSNWFWSIFIAFMNILLRIASTALYLSAKLFDLALELSIVKFHDYANMAAISNAWIILRDIVNLFFIFIVLYIAIATILQLSTYNMKSLLVTVIIIALLVNFSMMFTKIIIDMSNVLALEFYNSLTRSPSGQHTELSDTVTAKLRIQTVYRSYDPDERAAVSNQLSASGALLGMLGGVIFIGVAAYVFLSFAFMFLIRTAVLLFIIVLSPLAFLGMALPVMRKKASAWWQALFDQAFFAPACLFLVYVSLGIMSSGDLMTLAGVNSNSGLLDALFGDVTGATNNVGIVLYFAIIITFLLVSLKIGKAMASTGSQGIYAFADKARDWTIGQTKYAGAWSLRKLGETRRRDEGGGQETTMGQRVARRLNRFAMTPIVGGALQKMGRYVSGSEAFEKGQKENIEKLNRLGVRDQAKYIKGRLVHDSTRKEWFKGLSPEKRVQMKSELGSDTYDNLMKSLPVDEKEKTEKRDKEIARKASVAGLKDLNMANANNRTKFEEDIKKVTPEEAKKLDPSVFQDNDKLDYMIKNFHEGHLKNMRERTDTAYRTFVTRLKDNVVAAGVAPTLANLQTYLTGSNVDNVRLAEWANGKSGQNALRIIGQFT